MGVQFNQVLTTSTTTNMPTTSAVTWTDAFNAPGGPVEYLVMRFDILFGADPCAADFSNLVDSIRVILNGEVVHDYRAGITDDQNNAAGRYGYLLNSIGGRAYEVVGGTTTREGYYGIPIGRQTPSGVNRWEIIIGWAATNTSATPTSGSVSFWLKTNDAMQTTTTVCPGTTFVHGNSLEQVVVRIPQNVPGVVSAILVQNDAFADEFGSQGLRANQLGAYGLEVEMWRWLNGDMPNGVMFYDPTDSSDAQTYETGLKGCMLLPMFGLSGGDVILQVDDASGSTTTRTYTPIITNPVGAKPSPEPKQTQRAPASTSATILKRTEN